MMEDFEVDELISYFGSEYLEVLFRAAVNNSIYIEGIQLEGHGPAERFLRALEVDMGGGTVETEGLSTEELILNARQMREE